MYISLGIDCGTANIFEKLKIRQQSFPFDWVVSYEGIAKIIENDFLDFIPIDQNCNEKLNKKYGVLFLHYDFSDDNEKMKRRIERFTDLLRTSREKIIFIRKSHGENHHIEREHVADDIDDAIQLDMLLKNKYPDLKYEIHVILLCNHCFSNLMKQYPISSDVKIHNIAKPYSPNVNITNPEHFDKLCKQLFRKN